MTDLLLFVIAGLLIVAVTRLVVIIKKVSRVDDSVLASRLDAFEKAQIRTEHTVRDEVALNRGELGKAAREQRQELTEAFKTFGDSVVQRMRDVANLQKAQLDNYDSVRAEFEAFNAHMDSAKPSTGVIYWMLNNAWPSLHWHLYDWYMNPAGAYFGAKKANEPVHIQYSYDDRAIVLVNHTLTDAHGLKARVRVRNLDGSVRYDKSFAGLDLSGNHTLTVTTLPAISGLSPAYFVELDLLSSNGQPVSRNVYWLSTQKDVLDWKNSNWYMTPLTQYANFTALQSLPAAASNVHATTRRDGDDNVTTVTLTVPESSKAVALFQHLSVRQSADGAAALPILWSDNDVTLWPGESVTMTARYAAKGTAAPVVEVSGWNVPVRHVPAVLAKEPLINPITRHPGESRDPVTFARPAEMQRRWVPDIASQFRDDEQKSELP